MSVFLIPNRLADSSLHCFHFYNLEQSTRTVAHVRQSTRAIERQKRRGQEGRSDYSTEADTGGHTTHDGVAGLHAMGDKLTKVQK